MIRAAGVTGLQHFVLAVSRRAPLSLPAMAWVDDPRFGSDDASGTTDAAADGDAAGGRNRAFAVRIIRNPRSHGNAALAPLDVPPGVEVIEPSRRGDTARALAHCREAGTDCLVIDGGDGTVRDVLTAGLAIFGDDWPVIGVLPRGKTNALAFDLGIPAEWTWREIAEHARQGRTTRRRPLVLAPQDAGGPAVAGFLVGAGSFAAGVEAAQDAHRIGMFGGLAVGATVAWAVAQTLLGGPRNRWRRGQAMDIALLPGGAPLPHRGGGDPGRRSLLLATTLRRLPLGLKLWGEPRDGLKLLVVDRARRSVFAAAPLIVAGRAPGWLERRGLHRVEAEGLRAAFAERFILDGEFLQPGAWRIEQGPPLRFVTP